jgi:hypothetical protein
VWNTHTHGRYVGSISHGSVVGLMKVRYFTWVQLCGVCKKTGVNPPGKVCKQQETPWITHGCAPQIR